MAFILVTPTGTSATKKHYEDAGYITIRKMTGIWLVRQISSSIITTKNVDKQTIQTAFNCK